ncbi:hypothetical protein WJX72_008013 [[Myrmecia] bisecta]|uniref:Expansin-like EG45 domain-containing protein n=1 Tax=[Myrmecia] bisecta TaxID=41462 RepID=A0AAW1QRM2_9CHLO
MAGVRLTATVAVVVSCLVGSALAQSIYSGGTLQGLMTYYGSSGANGHCSYHMSGAQGLPWGQNVNFVAINSGQYQNSATCGMCIQYQGTGSGAGANPVPSTPQTAMVVNECPTCQDVHGIDLALDGDGAWGIVWTPVPCPGVGSSPFQYSCQNCNTGFNKILVANHRVPLASVAVNGVPLARSSDNYWMAGEVAYPAQITITSVTGQTVTDTLQPWSNPNGVQQGSVQFPDGGASGRKLMKMGNPVAHVGKLRVQ